MDEFRPEVNEDIPGGVACTGGRGVAVVRRVFSHPFYAAMQFLSRRNKVTSPSSHSPRLAERRIPAALWSHPVGRRHGDRHGPHGADSDLRAPADATIRRVMEVITITAIVIPPIVLIVGVAESRRVG